MDIILKSLKYRDVTCLILKVLPWWIWYYCFCSPIQSLVELESVIVATATYFEHTAPLTYSLWKYLWSKLLFHTRSSWSDFNHGLVILTDLGSEKQVCKIESFVPWIIQKPSFRYMCLYIRCNIYTILISKLQKL